MGFSTPETVVTSGTGYTVTGPDWGEVGGPSATFTVQRDNTGPTLVTFTPTLPNGTIAPTSIAVPKNALDTFTVNPADYGAGTLTITNDGGLGTVTRAFFAKIPVGASIYQTPDPGRDWGGWTPNTTGALGLLSQDVASLPKDANSDAIMAFWVTTFGVNKKVNFDQLNQNYCRQYNVVAGDQAMVPVKLGIYASSSDQDGSGIGYAPIPSNAAVNGFATPPTTQAQAVGDCQLQIFDRDSKKCYALFNAWYDPIEAIWNCRNLTVWDYEKGGGGFATGAAYPYLPTEGSIRFGGITSETTGGLPLLAGTLRYDEAIRGPVQTCKRMTTGTTGNAPKFTYPGRHMATGGSGSGLPFGARLRLSSAWYEANKATFGTTGVGPSHAAANILWGFRNRGLISTDHTSSSVHMQVEIAQSSQWAGIAGLEALMESIPMTAFEVVEMTRGYTYTADKAWCRVGETMRLTVRYEPYYDHGDANFGTGAYFSLTGGTTIRNANVVKSAANFGPPGPVSAPTIEFNWTPQVADIGTHQLSNRDIAGNYNQAPVSFTVIAIDAPDPDPQPTPGDPPATGNYLVNGLGTVAGLIRRGYFSSSSPAGPANATLLTRGLGVMARLVTRGLFGTPAGPTYANFWEALVAYFDADATLAALFPNGVYANRENSPDEYPLAVYTEVSEPRTGYGGGEGTYDGEFQIEVYAASKAEATRLGIAVAGAITDAPLLFDDGLLVYLGAGPRFGGLDPDKGPGGIDVYQSVVTFRYIIQRER